MKQVFDLLDLRVLVTIDGLELSGTVPIGDWDDDEAAVGELRSGVPQRLGSNLTGAVALHFVHVDDWVPQRIVTATRTVITRTNDVIAGSAYRHICAS